ncbi:Vitamin K-dependent gamma-carboxylase [Streptomyces sp. 2224.1]|uniref:HTTM domain-containing protein n=1 Tax=unclassified Streptomyces TaxID=2593676 RepID=UPI000884D7C1|nr:MULTISPECIES: HTTM domain-containing protein [unclassified Streptomyces]PBC86559.1 vitamin K-dependent gamma-carboxylase-like protein [Streptomyces sp. 2321.6]SDQ80200.1 Vitamin K-dependent gamma-carboxylase [Streptomyces sp. KS_16]SED59120.1 Vitamin K-dependent gamma-carboxylase [Streptomyces sp. 2112.3]SED88307.1 Vitamin K-dependent gamma-carboxylase [Streptomyces sp. 2224.1]SEE02285.1 Vitamin K-dependent gamma-carboxylase [Streptomyces sp. 2133.1]
MSVEKDTARAPSPFKDFATKLDRAIARGLNKITGLTLAPYQAAVVRIGFALTFGLYLLREWPHRQELYGTTSPWGLDLAHRLVASNHAFTVLLWSSDRLWFELVYHGTILACLLLFVGWHTRTTSLLFMIGVLSLLNRNVLLGDGGDTLIHLIASYLVLTRCGQVWSLDARRRARAAALGEEDRNPVGVALWGLCGLGLALAQITGFAQLPWGWILIFWGMWLIQALWYWAGRSRFSEVRGVLDVTANLVHNSAMFVIAAQVCLLYATAGWYKIQGPRWQDGTALHYPLHLNYFSPWTPLSQALDSGSVIVTLITYGTVIAQVAFPFTLLNRRVKNVLLAVLMTEHATIAVICGLPFFSLAMVVADMVFLPTNFLRWIGSRVSSTRKRITRPLRRDKEPQVTGVKARV